ANHTKRTKEPCFVTADLNYRETPGFRPAKSGDRDNDESEYDDQLCAAHQLESHAMTRLAQRPLRSARVRLRSSQNEIYQFAPHISFRLPVAFSAQASRSCRCCQSEVSPETRRTGDTCSRPFALYTTL